MSKKRRFLRLDAVEERIGLRKATIYAKAARGEFPQSRKIG
jgi:predicted DNA-binding transcriptional regulator AlpA